MSSWRAGRRSLGIRSAARPCSKRERGGVLAKAVVELKRPGLRSCGRGGTGRFGRARGKIDGACGRGVHESGYCVTEYGIPMTTRANDSDSEQSMGAACGDGCRGGVVEAQGRLGRTDN